MYLQQVRKRDRIVLIHLRTSQFVQLTDKKYEDEPAFEINLYNSPTTWIVDHFAKFLPESDKFVKVLYIDCVVSYRISDGKEELVLDLLICL